MTSQRSDAIENLMSGRRTFPPDPAFTARANAKAGIYEEAARDPVAFWERLARERITWTKPFHTALEWELPFARWFVGGELRKRLLAAFREHGIEIPRPQRVVLARDGRGDPVATDAGPAVSERGPTEDDLAAGSE